MEKAELEMIKVAEEEQASEPADEDNKNNKYIVPSIARALKILEYLAKDNHEASIAEIASSFDYPKNSVFRVMKSLEYYGFVEEESRKYRTTPRLLYLGYASMQNKGIVEASMDVMHALRDEVNETVLIGTLLGNKVVIIDQYVSFELIKFVADIGMRVPLHTSAPGKVILAYLPEDERGKLIDHMNFVRYTDMTVPSKRAMLEEIRNIRSQGYAVDDGEEVPEIHCIGVPIFDYRHYPVAAIWIVGPSTRLPKDIYPKIGRIVGEYAVKISRRLGFDG